MNIYIYVYMSIKERIDQNSEIQGRHETFERNSSLQVYENAIVQKRQENVATLGGVGWTCFFIRSIPEP